LRFPRLPRLRRKGSIGELTDDERDKKVLEELTQTKQCIIQEDFECVSKRLEEAAKTEVCGVCKGEMVSLRKQVKHLPKEKSLEKVDLLIGIIEPASGIRSKIHSLRSIKPAWWRRRPSIGLSKIQHGLGKLKFW